MALRKRNAIKLIYILQRLRDKNCDECHGVKMLLPFYHNFAFADSRDLQENSMMPDRSRETYLLETSIHDSDLLAGKLGLPQKFLYRHRPGSLVPRSRALEFEERFFRSRRVRRRCHDL